MWGRLPWLASVLLVLLRVAPGSAASPSDADSGLAEFAGRYQRADGSVDLVYLSHGGLALRPLLWTSTQYLRAVGADSFVVDERRDRRVDFRRDRNGRVSGVAVAGIDGDAVLARVAGAEPLPVELLLLDRGAEAAARFIAEGPCGVDAAVRLATRIVSRRPAHAAAAVECLGAIVSAFPDRVDAHVALGDGRVRLGDRTGAGLAYAAALALDPDAVGARRALSRLRAGGASGASGARETTGWTVPFALSALLRPPTGGELRAALADWSRRDLSARDVERVETTELDLGHVVAELRVISHRVHGQRHFGAVLVPRGARPGSCPVVVEAKGVSWDYFPLDLREVPLGPRILGAEQGRFVYVVPSFRGEALLVGDRRYVSEGDRTDSWDGATDDAMAALSAALSVTPEADPERVCVLGKSRGGSVALLMGERDPRVDCVLAWAGPTDWFELMAEGGWTQEELVADGLRSRSTPGQVAGQFIERFLRRAISGHDGLAASRHRLLASSPLHFAERLPRTQIQYGDEDTMVPAVNGRALVERLRARPPGCLEAVFYPDAGHDLDLPAALASSRRFLLESFTETAPGCR